MVTYDDYIQTCYDLANDDQAANLDFIKRIGNTGYRRAMRLFGRQFEERTKTTTTVASQQYYQLPIDYTFMKSIKILVGTYQYPLTEVKGQVEWDNLNRLTNIVNQRPIKYFIRLNSGVGGDEVGIWPTPSTTGNLMTLVYEAAPKTVGNTKYTTGTVSISTATNTLIGTGTAFLPQMVGRHVQIADPQGDDQFYKVKVYLSSTQLQLENYYEGPTVSGSAYGIYELFGIAEEAQMIPVYYTLWHYFLMRQNQDKADYYRKLHDNELSVCKRNEAEKTRDGVVKRGQNVNLAVEYPLFFPQNITSS